MTEARNDFYELLATDSRRMIVELFGGPGGASLGIRAVLPETPHVAIEWDEMACRTRRAAGLLTIRADVASYPTEPFVGKVLGLWLSPPCPDFSAAGKRAGIEGTSGHLIFQVLRWALAVRPVWIACEQVKEVLPWWKHFAGELTREGYKTWAGILCAADYGVPQERYRAVLMAHESVQPHPPEPTHAESPHRGLFDGAELPRWVSMAEGLGWGSTAGPAPTVTAGGTKTGGAEPIARGGRERLERDREEGAWMARTGS